MRFQRTAYLLLALLGPLLSPAQTITVRADPAPARESTLGAYRAHLSALRELVVGCKANLNGANCDAKRVGADDRVQFITQSGRHLERIAHYQWLRDVLTRVTTPPPANSVRLHPAEEPLTSQQALLQAIDHLALDQQQAAGAVEEPNGNHQRQQQTLDAILSAQEFDQVKQPSLWNQLTDKLVDWANRHVSSIASLGHKSRWIARAFIWSIILLPCVLLAWWVIRQERQLRSLGLRDKPGENLPAGSPAARDWQKWLEEARELAAARQWRAAIHNLYWAAISRLESRRVWPADRARTPREYLQLLAADDPRRADLTVLTRQFESAWYGFRDVAEPDYTSAFDRVERLAR